MSEDAKAVGELDRKTYIGGSDAAAILGLSPYEDSTPLGAYLRKKGLLQPSSLEMDEARAKALRRGKREEPRIIDDLIEDHGIKVTKRSTPEAPNRYIDTQWEFIAAEVDFEWEVTQAVIDAHGLDQALLGTTQNGEVKTAHHFVFKKKFGEEGTEEVPVEYAAQIMHGLMVTGRQLAMVPVRNGFDTFLYWVRRDDETIAAMRGAEVSFWTEHVELGVPPAPKNLPDILQLFRIKPSSTVEATPEVAELVEQLRARSAEARLLTENGGVIDDLKFRIGRHMLGDDQMRGPSAAGKHILTLGGREILSVTLQSSSRIDQKRLYKEQPEIAEQYRKSTSFFVFRPKKGVST